MVKQPIKIAIVNNITKFVVFSQTCYTSPCCCSYDLYDDVTKTRTICNPKLIAIFGAWIKFKGPIKLQGCEVLSLHWIRETIQIEVIIVRPNVHVNISEQFTICECMRPSFQGSVNMDLDVDEDDYLRKEIP